MVDLGTYRTCVSLTQKTGSFLCVASAEAMSTHCHQVAPTASVSSLSRSALGWDYPPKEP